MRDAYEPIEMDLVDPEAIIDAFFEVNDGPRWIDTIDEVHAKLMED